MKLGKIIVSIISVIIMCTFSMVVASASASPVELKGYSPEKAVSGSSSNDLYVAAVTYGPILSDASKADVSYIMSKNAQISTAIRTYKCVFKRTYKTIFGNNKTESTSFLDKTIEKVYTTDSFNGKKTTKIVLDFVNSDSTQFTFVITFQ